MQSPQLITDHCSLITVHCSLSEYEARSPAPPSTDPDVRNYRIRFLLRVECQDARLGFHLFLLLHISARLLCACEPGSVPGAWSPRANSPWPVPFPPLPPQYTFGRTLFGVSQVLWNCMTSCIRASSACVLRLPDAVCLTLSGRQTQDLPIPI